MRRATIAAAVLAPALAFALARGQGADEATPEIVREYDLTYAKVGDAELKLDVARPAEGDGPFPAVFVIHGGAWRAGNKKDTRQLVERFARRGYVAVSPQYRFCPGEVFPAQVHDVKAAVRWLKAHAAEHKVDPGRVGAMGFSAGGHLALMLGLTGPDDGLDGEAPADGPDARVHAVVNFFGPTDMHAPDIPEPSRPLLRDFLGGSPAEKPDAATEASPVTHVSKDDPPTLTFQGTKDPLVPHTQAFRLTEAMTAAGIPGRVELLVGAGHGWGGETLEYTLAETFAFFDRHLRPDGDGGK